MQGPTAPIEMTGYMLVRYYNEIEFEGVVNSHQVITNLRGETYSSSAFDSKRYSIPMNCEYNQRETYALLKDNNTVAPPGISEHGLADDFDMLSADNFE